MFCWEHASELAKLKPQFDEAGVLLAVVAVGTPEGAQAFSKALPFPKECLFVDPERKAYSALDFHGDLDGSEGLFFDPKVMEGVKRLFFTKVTGERIKERGLMEPEGRANEELCDDRAAPAAGCGAAGRHCGVQG